MTTLELVLGAVLVVTGILTMTHAYYSHLLGVDFPVRLRGRSVFQYAFEGAVGLLFFLGGLAVFGGAL